MRSGDLPLLDAFPTLRERCPRRPFLDGPTPVEPLALEGLPPGSLFVKRDERSCALYGGNKPRKLEFVVGAALARGARRLVTTGGLGTNHGLATTILGRDAGLATTLVLVDQPVTAGVKQTLLLHAAWGAELVYGGSVPGAAIGAARVLARSSLRGERPMLVSTGGSSVQGIAGAVAAGYELAAQVREGVLPEPAEVWVAVGTGGTLAGLVPGMRLGGLATRAVGVLVTDILPPTPRSLLRDARRALAWLRRRDASLPAVEVGPSDFELVLGYVGPGYGAPTQAARDAVARAAEQGLSLETTYTGKCLAALLERTRQRDRSARPTLFWNTYNAVDVASTAPHPLDRARLPQRFRRFLDAREAD